MGRGFGLRSGCVCAPAVCDRVLISLVTVLVCISAMCGRSLGLLAGPLLVLQVDGRRRHAGDAPDAADSAIRTALQCVDAVREGWASKRSALAARCNGLGGCASAQPFKSQHREDMVLLPLMLHITNDRPGTFVELGALDGEMFSNTFAYEHCLQWRGLLIEADAENFEQLQRSKRNVSIAHAAVCDERTGTLPITSSAHQPWGSGVVQEMTTHARRSKLVLKKGRSTTRLIPCKPLSTLMAAADLASATFLSLDVEGAELTVLRNANLSSLQVMLVHVHTYA